MSPLPRRIQEALDALDIKLEHGAIYCPPPITEFRTRVEWDGLFMGQQIGGRFDFGHLELVKAENREMVEIRVARDIVWQCLKLLKEEKNESV